MNKKIQRLSEPGVGMYMLFLAIFAAATVVIGLLDLTPVYLAAAEAVVVLGLMIYNRFARKSRARQLAAFIEELTYDTDSARNNTLLNFPLPIAVFRLDDTRVVWGNDMFFAMGTQEISRVGAHISDMVPQFGGKWLMEGKSMYPGLLEVKGRKYQVHGNIIRSEEENSESAYMGITYWVDVTEYDNTRLEYINSRPMAGIIVIDNLEELYRNQSDRVRNDILDAIADRLSQWSEERGAILKRYDRDRFLVLMEHRYLEELERARFPIIEDIHTIASPNGINATISIGLGVDAGTMGETMQFANMAIELALSRGGDQVAVKNRVSFEFYGGRGNEVEKRTKVKSRVVATTLAELIRDSSRVYAMGHTYSDLDCVGAAVGVCCLARKCGTPANIVIDEEHTASAALIERLKKDEEYADAFITPEEAMLRADGRTLLVVVDINRPERVEDKDLLESCNRVAVIDHHRVGATYIQNAALSFIEPYASSACELMTEILQEVAEPTDILKVEAEAILAGIVLDTKSFSIRTGERTFDAAAYLRRLGADTADVKRLLQSDVEDTVAKYKILQSAELYRGVAIAASDEAQNRVVAAKAADELLNISGVDASVVIARDGKGGAFASARSIGEMNMQILMEKLGGGGNRSAAAAAFPEEDIPAITERLKAVIDDYLN